MFVVWLKKTAPSCWYCCNANPLIPILKSFTCIRSHFQRILVSQLLSLISCIPVMSWKRLLCSPAACEKRFMSSSLLHLMKASTHATYNPLPTKKSPSIVQS